ncbi:Arc family DNA-binding protein [Ancylobacter sp. VNQ12]|uniref:Arc family DNA-binding protein n=1 Tax=Ancylobacter sp. VNQ12 TaxID=3400920 RepID=UPI003C0D343F
MLRLPEWLRDVVKARAAESERNMNAEIIFQLKRAYGAAATTGASLQADTPVVAQNTAALQGGDIINLSAKDTENDDQ